MVVDCHIHLTEPVELILEEMDRHHVDKGFVCPSGIAQGERIRSLATAREMMDAIAQSRKNDPAVGVKTVERWNRKIVKDLASYSDRLKGFAKVDLRLSKEMMNENMEDGIGEGLVGFGEILGVESWPEHFGYLVTRSAEMGGYPVFVHGDFPVTEEVLKTVAWWAGEVPETPIIIGHIGGDYWIHAIEHALEKTNMYLDISEAVNLVAVRAAVSEVPEKVLFGSDFPWETMGVGIERVRNLHLSEDVEERVFSRNAEKLFGGPSVIDASNRGEGETAGWPE